jgi:hypothetical protein
MDVINVFNYNPERQIKQVALKLSVEISKGELTVKVQEGADFEKASRGFGFREIVSGVRDGKNTDYKDTDSLQVALLWSSTTNKDVAHATNAIAVEAGPRKMGASWIFQNGSASWTKAVPEGATHFEAVMVYTDTILGTPYNGGGDLPVIVGAFSGDLSDGKWNITANADLVTKPRQATPNPTEYAKIVAETKKTLMDKTSYKLQERPEGLTSDDSEKNFQTLDNAYKKSKTINGYQDTGYDIVPRK